MSVSLVSNSYLDETSSKIRSKPVPWEGYQRADLVTSEELSLIKKVDRQPRAKIESLLLSDGQNYALLYLRLLKKLQRLDTMQSILVLIADALADHDERIPLFTRAAETDPELPYVPLLRTLDMQDEFMQLKAAQILTVLLCSEPKPLQARLLQPFLNILATMVQSSSLHKHDVGVQCLEALLARPECRQAVWAIPSIIKGFVDILKRKPGPQMSYQVAFCLWLLSFEQNVSEQINKKFDIIPLLVSVAQEAAKEKVIRVIVATFRNLVVKAPSANLPAMLVAQLLPFAKNLCTRKWGDEDIVEDVQFLRDELAANFQSLTTYDEYTSELASGHLSWTPVHESDDFWKENATKLNDKDYEQLKILIRLLKESPDANVLAVAAHDIGQYVKHYERGKKYVVLLSQIEVVSDRRSFYLTKARNRLRRQDKSDGANDPRELGRSLSRTDVRPAARQSALGSGLKRWLPRTTPLPSIRPHNV
ncbi:H(+)-transporting V1 sector ATPase subunit H [Marasmius crinis-equi]|uniref:V-type proton ATPase subunit H n=1 Tax=Marasmius crinis-equi TaxID=585013 RepID=A0ABR3FS11_9AGAR